MADPYDPIPLDFTEYPPDEMRERARAFREQMSRRRSVRDFSDRPVPRELIKEAIRTAGSAPSGAHRQPWQFVAVDDPDLKTQIREAAEEEEKEFYENRATEEWKEALAPLGTDWRKPYLETAPWLVVCFAEQYGLAEDGEKTKNYYVQESVGIACGLFITAIHNMGLATLTPTPAPMSFLRDLLDRPSNERSYILFPVGYPAEDATVPDIERKSLVEFVQWNRGGSLCGGRHRSGKRNSVAGISRWAEGSGRKRELGKGRIARFGITGGTGGVDALPRLSCFSGNTGSPGFSWLSASSANRGYSCLVFEAGRTEGVASIMLYLAHGEGRSASSSDLKEVERR